MSCSAETTDETLARDHRDIGPCRTVKVSHLNVHLIEAGSGQDDPWHPQSMAREFARRITGAQVVVLTECGHLPHEERPDDFNRLVSEFLAHHQGEGT